jgi:hydroxyacylglutathione hydrolase
MSHLAFHVFICRSDNYGVLIHDHKSGLTASIDAPDAAEIERQLDYKGWQLSHIFTTHHHGDHVDGNIALKQQYGCSIIGPAADSGGIPGLDMQVLGGDVFIWSGREVRVLGCPGHTKGHVAYHIPSDESVFAGDTLFSLGCGRVFEGTMEQMYRSVSQFKVLAPSTRVYFGHEYTQSNARFALSVEPGNAALQERAVEVDSLRAEGRMTCPTTIGEELRINPFLRTGSPEIRRNLHLETQGDVEVFAELRGRKDLFK